MEKSAYNSIEMNRFAKKVDFLDNPKRRGDIPPEQLLTMLPLNKANHILDIGAGTGYITIPAAKIVEGQVYALDIDSNMLELVNAKALKENLTNVKTLKGGIEDMPLPNNSIDVAIASLVLHEVKQLANTLQQIKQVLKPDGYLVCIEFERKENSADFHPRIASSTMEQAITNEGFSVIEKLNLTDVIYMIIAKNS